MAYGFRRCCDTPASPRMGHARGCPHFVQPFAEAKAEELQRHNRETVRGYKGPTA